MFLLSAFFGEFTNNFLVTTVTTKKEGMNHTKPCAYSTNDPYRYKIQDRGFFSGNN